MYYRHPESNPHVVANSIMHSMPVTRRSFKGAKKITSGGLQKCLWLMLEGARKQPVRRMIWLQYIKLSTYGHVAPNRDREPKPIVQVRKSSDLEPAHYRKRANS